MSTIIGTTLILVMAANTAFADFPRLDALVARWISASPIGFQRQSTGLFLWHCFTGVDCIRVDPVIQCSVSGLNPLYAIGVFLSLHRRQACLIVGGRSAIFKPGAELVERGSTLHHDPRWVVKMVVTNGVWVVCYWHGNADFRRD